MDTTDARNYVLRGITVANLDAMCKAACEAAPWRQDDWKQLRHELEELLTAEWRREDSIKDKAES